MHMFEYIFDKYKKEIWYMNEYLTLEEVGKMLCVSKSTLQRWDRNGKLSAVRTEGGHRRYIKDDIISFMNEIEGVTYSSLYAHLSSAEKISSRICQSEYEGIKRIKEKVGVMMISSSKI